MNSKEKEIEKRRILDPLIDKIFGSSRSSRNKNQSISKRTESVIGRISNDLTSIVKMTTKIRDVVQKNESGILTKPAVGDAFNKSAMILSNMLSFMQKNREQDTKELETKSSFDEMNLYLREDRHKEIMDVFVEATKTEREAQRKMEQDSKKRKTTFKKIQEQTKPAKKEAPPKEAPPVRKEPPAKEAPPAKQVEPTPPAPPTAAPAPPTVTPKLPVVKPAITEAAKTAAKVGVGTIVAGLSAVGITNTYAQAAVLANVKKESDFKLTSENLNYTTLDRLRKVFPSKTKSKTDSELKQYLNNPEGLAEFVYGGKMKNDNPGDGFKYRGRGSIQLTGKQNYEYYGKLLKVDLLENPDLVLNPEINAKIVALYTKQTLGKKVNEFKTQEEANRAVTQAIGGSKLNLDKGIGAELLKKVDKASLDYSAEKIQNLSTENADIKKNLSGGSSNSPVIIEQNIINNQQKNVNMNSVRREELNPTMRN